MIDPAKIYNDIASYVAVTVISGLGGWILTLRRKVNTNEAQIKQDRQAHQAQMSLIMQRLDMRDQSREEDRENVERLGVDVRELRTDIRQIKDALINKK